MYLKTTKMADLPTVKTLAVPLCEEAHTCVPRALCSFPGGGGLSICNKLQLCFKLACPEILFRDKGEDPFI